MPVNSCYPREHCCCEKFGERRIRNHCLRDSDDFEYWKKERHGYIEKIFWNGEQICSLGPHMLTPKQNQARLDWVKKQLDRFNGGTHNDVYNNVKYDETDNYLYDPEPKRQYAE